MTKFVSEKQILANRMNAKRGWVKTPEGKEISKMNALTHWIYSPILFDKGELYSYTLIRLELEEEYKPDWFSEEAQIRQIALYEVKLRRISWMEETFLEACNRFNLIRGMVGLEELERDMKVDVTTTLKSSDFDDANPIRFRDLEETQRLWEYRDMLENRKAKCIHDLMKIQFFKKNINS